ncbi:MAG: nucleotidyltransferase domain-containing protein [Treponema sp.]|nr:nucleotidyltransferase domain-containing protein [Treponema sp.]MBQ7167688.1 nucleotidyltransferase domain-containing protein [Treponema sp.]
MLYYDRQRYKMVTNEIRCIAKRLEQSVNPHKIYLFGSFARNEERADSDYDFYLVMADSVTDRLLVSQTAYRSLRGMKRRSVDIVVGSVSGFEERKNRKPLESVIDREGVVLYEK